MGELARVCAPNGKVLIVTWCHRVLRPGEAALSPDEQSFLDRICEAYYLPAWCSIADYQRLFGEHTLLPPLACLLLPACLLLLPLLLATTHQHL